MIQRIKQIFQRANYLNVRSALKIKGFPVIEAERLFNETISTTDFRRYQEQMKWEILNYHLNENSNYRKICMGNCSDWKQVPVINRKVLKGNYSNWIPEGLAGSRLFKGSTSGSSGIPFEFARDRFSHAITWAAISYFYRKANIRINEYQARFYGILMDGSAHRFAIFKDLVANRYRFNVYDVTDQAIDKGLRKFRQHRFKYIYGYTNTLLAYANYLIKNNIKLSELCPSLKCCIVTSEYCSENDAERMETAFGIPVFNEYGSAEMGIVGFKRGIDAVWEVPNNLLYIEVLDSDGHEVEDGTVGLLTFTHYFNKATPLIRYQTGDIGSVSRDQFGCIAIHSLGGRIGDILQLPNGKLIPTFTFYYVVKDLISKGALIDEFMVEQLIDDSFVLKYVAENELSEELNQALLLLFERYISPHYPVRTQRVAFIERGANGKFRHFISHKNVNI